MPAPGTRRFRRIRRTSIGESANRDLERRPGRLPEGAPRTPRALRALAIASWGEGTSRLAAFLTIVIVAQATSGAEFGRFSFVVAAIGIGMTLADVGLQTAATRLIATAPRATDALVSASGLLGLASACVIYAAIAAAAAVGALPSGTEAAALVYGLCLLVAAPVNALWSALRAWNRQGVVYALYAGSSMLVLILAALVAVREGPTVEAFVGAYVAGMLARLVASLWIVRRVLGVSWVRPTRAQVLTVARATQLAALAFFLLGVYSHIDVVLLGYLVEPSAVGEYAAVYRLVDGITFLTAGALTTIMVAQLSRAAASSRASAAALLRGSLALLLAILVPPAVVFAAIGDELVSIMFGFDTQTTGDVVLILAGALPLIGMSFYLVFASLAIGYEREATLATALAAITNIAANLVLVPSFGIAAAAANTLLAEIVLLIAISRALGARGIALPVARGIVVSMVAMGATVAALLLAPAAGVIVPAMAAVGGLVVAALIWRGYGAFAAASAVLKGRLA